MSTARTIAFNSWAIFSGRLLSKIIGLATLFLLARYLGVELFGQYSLALTFVGFFLYLNDFGVTSVVVRKLVQQSGNESDLVSKAMTLKILFSVGAVALSLAFAFFLGYPIEIMILIFIFSLSIVPSSITSIFNGVFQARLQNHYAIFSEIVNYAIYLLLILPLIILNASLQLILLAFFLAAIASLFASWFFARKFVKISFKVDVALWKSMVFEGYPFAFALISSSLYSRIDVLMISKMLNDSAVGLYSAGFRLTESLAIIPNSLVIPLFPLMSGMFKNSAKNLDLSYRLGFRYLVVFFLPVAVGGSILAQRIILLVYGPEFASNLASSTLVVLLWSAFVMFLNQISITALNSAMKEKTVMKSYVLGILVNVGLNFFLIPVYGIVGAAITTLVTESIMFFIFYFSLKNIFAPKISLLFKPMVAAAIMTGFVLYFFSQNLFVLVFLGGIIYFVALFFAKAFTKQDKEIFMKVFGQKMQ